MSTKRVGLNESPKLIHRVRVYTTTTNTTTTTTTEQQLAGPVCRRFRGSLFREVYKRTATDVCKLRRRGPLGRQGKQSLCVLETFACDARKAKSWCHANGSSPSALILNPPALITQTEQTRFALHSKSTWTAQRRPPCVLRPLWLRIRLISAPASPYPLHLSSTSLYPSCSPWNPPSISFPKTGDHYLFAIRGLKWMGAADDPGPLPLAVMGALRRLESNGSSSEDSSSFDLLYLIPIVLGALLLLSLALYLLCGRRSRRPRKSSEQFQVFDTPPIVTEHGAADDAPVVSPMDPMASFSSFKDVEVANKNVWLSGSGRTLNSAKSGCSSRSLTASTVADYVLDTTQRDEIFHVLHHDSALATQRLAVDKIAFERVLGETHTRRLWLCQFEGDEIVVKRLQPPDKEDDVFPALKTFVHEIQMTASLEHPNVVRFLGVAWGQSLRSLCFVAEYLSRGDLASFLRRCRKRRQQLTLHTSSSSVSDASRGSSSSTTTAQTALTGPSPPPSLQSSGSGFTLTSWVDDKLPIAIGIMRAVVYLHTRRSKPIVYRVLRARKVAMSDHFEPKLIDLTPAAGGSPPVDQEEMAAGVGNAFWTAPELLSGEAPTQASDIYAFGVLLAEIDSEGKRPYHTARDTRSGEKLRAFRVLNLVASGELRPHFAANCPPGVREIALACMRQNPMQRPTAREVLQALQSCAACSAA